MTKNAVVDHQYADDCAILAYTAEELQTSLDLLTKAYKKLGHSINTRKTKIIYQTAASNIGNIEGTPEIKVSGTTL